MRTRVPEDRRCQAAVYTGWSFRPCDHPAKVGTCLAFQPEPERLSPARQGLLTEPFQACGLHWNVFTTGGWVSRYMPRDGGRL